MPAGSIAIGRFDAADGWCGGGPLPVRRGGVRRFPGQRKRWPGAGTKTRVNALNAAPLQTKLASSVISAFSTFETGQFSFAPFASS